MPMLAKWLVRAPLRPLLMPALVSASAVGCADPARNDEAHHHAKETIAADRSAPVSRPAKVSLPVDASGFVSLTDVASGLSLRFTIEDAKPVAIAMADGIAVYRGAVGGADL